MSEALRPTAEDMARDLAAALERAERVAEFVTRREPLSEGRCTLVRTREGFTEVISHTDALDRLAAIRRARHAEAEIARLQGMIEGLAARAAAQSELLSRKAEGQP